ncbi:SPOR domain-containing protein, partial [Arhodomonas sp. KWT]
PDEEAPAEQPRTGEDWLASRDGGRYTLQLIAGRKKQTTANFLDAHPEVRDSARVVTVSGDNGTWHLVLLGDYPSRSAAMRDVPASIGADNVYPRRFSSVRN